MAHPHGAGFQPGNYWAECDRCGFDYRIQSMRMEWNGLVVCHKCFEVRHPQDFVKAVEDRIAPFGPVRIPKLSHLDQSAVSSSSDSSMDDIFDIINISPPDPVLQVPDPGVSIQSAVVGIAIVGLAVVGTE